MKRIFLLGLIIIAVLTSCKKATPAIPAEPSNPPAMHYTDLQNAEIKPGQFKEVDLDNDGNTDFFFSTLLVGDPVLQRDRLQFYAYSKVATCLLNDAEDQSPALNKGDEILLQQNGYRWFEISAVVLAEKITPLYGGSFWQGTWKNASYQYLAVEIKKNGNDYLGWIEISFDTAACKFVLHAGSVSTEPGKKIKAGF